MSTRSRLLFYGASRSVAEGLLGLRGVLLAVLLGAEGFGLWTLFRLGTRYGTFADLGVERGLEFRVVRARSAADGSEAEARAWGRSAAGYTWLVFGAGSLGLAAAALAAPGAETALVLGGLAAGLLLDRLWCTGRAYLRALDRLRQLIARELGYAALQLALPLVGAVWGGLAGAFAGFALATALCVVWLARDVPFAPRPSLARLRSLAAVGLPLATPVWLTIGLTTVDRLVVAARGDAALLGSYAFAVALAGIATSVALTIRTVVFPRVFAAPGAAGAAAHARRHLEPAVRSFALFLPPLLGALGLLLPQAVDAFLPEYRSAVPVARLFVFTGVFVGLQSLGLLAVAATGRDRPVPALALAAMGANAGLSWLALETGHGLYGVALAALVARGGFAVVVVRLAGGPPAAGRWREGAALLLPSLWCIGAVEAIARLVPGRDAGAALAALGLYALCLAPLIPALAARIRALRRPATG